MLLLRSVNQTLKNSQNSLNIMKNELINESLIEDSFTYDEYRLMVADFVAHAKTSGPKQSEELAHYTKLNNQRMSRLDKTIQLIGKTINLMEGLKGKYVWLVITEAWCGDAAQNLPYLNKMAELNKNIQLRMIYRDENPEIMDLYLTNGSRSIPKLVCLNWPNLDEVFTWGPRPKNLQIKIDEFRAQGMDYKSYQEPVQKWYNEDAGFSLQEEFIELLKNLK